MNARAVRRLADVKPICGTKEVRRCNMRSLHICLFDIKANIIRLFKSLEGVASHPCHFLFSPPRAWYRHAMLGGASDNVR